MRGVLRVLGHVLMLSGIAILVFSLPLWLFVWMDRDYSHWPFILDVEAVAGALVLAGIRMAFGSKRHEDTKNRDEPRRGFEVRLVEPASADGQEKSETPSAEAEPMKPGGEDMK